MANINLINIGNLVNDGLGDDLRTAFQKVNANFSALNSELTITASNTAGAGAGVFKEKLGTDLVFKKLVSGNRIGLNDTGNAIIINYTDDPAFTAIHPESGLEVSAATYPEISLTGAAAFDTTTGRKDILVSSFGSTLSFRTTIPVVDILTSYDFGFINGSYNNSLQAIYAASNMDFGTIDLPGTFDLDAGTIL